MNSTEERITTPSGHHSQWPSEARPAAAPLLMSSKEGEIHLAAATVSLAQSLQLRMERQGSVDVGLWEQAGT